MTGSKKRYFGQHGEDAMLWQLFGDQADGFFVDVGAFDGVHLSNSYSFELAGWKGVCVEAIPDMYERCRAARPGTTCVHAACVGSPDVDEVSFKVEKLGLLSGLDAADEDDIRARYASRGLEFEGFQEVAVTARTLNSILEEHLPEGKGIDFVSIDVEGAEVQVLQGFDLARYRPRCLVIEANDDDCLREIDNVMVSGAGYTRARMLGCNYFYARDAADAERLKTMQIRCRIEPTLHPLGEEFTLADHLHGKRICTAPTFVDRMINKAGRVKRKLSGS